MIIRTWRPILRSSNQGLLWTTSTRCSGRQCHYSVTRREAIGEKDNNELGATTKHAPEARDQQDHQFRDTAIEGSQDVDGEQKEFKPPVFRYTDGRRTHFNPIRVPRDVDVEDEESVFRRKPRYCITKSEDGDGGNQGFRIRYGDERETKPGPRIKFMYRNPRPKPTPPETEERDPFRPQRLDRQIETGGKIDQGNPVQELDMQLHLKAAEVGTSYQNIRRLDVVDTEITMRKAMLSLQRWAAQTSPLDKDSMQLLRGLINNPDAPKTRMIHRAIRDLRRRDKKALKIADKMILSFEKVRRNAQVRLAAIAAIGKYEVSEELNEDDIFNLLGPSEDESGDDEVD